ncbi:uncharacterized protein BDCG_17050 [Blastomyces dermatitidis ER-3]|uniref:Uncharacterized protein n=3 Tax=Blastomyces TaxID=229219 RepID=A0A179UZ43_BLAGS|nr:uncharacterized protein BDBG_17740 [Blastomyces gilchristii SLH14081]XP_045281086.1 uncharacterized protein BDCG_17050 [Blastomyces dermatitidis ER-3]KMW67405.1 hypothetical protein BDDG_12105 [Blastomyces dermatitidis ATCC 18188]OAT01359.1 hypothetical protein BDCG_17050 [Blastomyces dermatitidis ER-3]OAT13103.1 hypothetical protein BDBG_17740 [Blastomyces gilchristii SLH14081]
MSIDDNSESMTRKRRNAFRLRNRVLILMTEFKSVILDPEDLKNFRVKITRLDLLAQENAVAGQQQFFTP